MPFGAWGFKSPLGHKQLLNEVRVWRNADPHFAFPGEVAELQAEGLVELVLVGCGRAVEQVDDVAGPGDGGGDVVEGGSGRAAGWCA